MKIEVTCFSCQKQMSFSDRVGLREECPHCSADVHSCRNCQHFDPKAYNECRETSADPVREKDRANYCDHFAPGQGLLKVSQQKQDLLSAAEALFKKKS